MKMGILPINKSKDMTSHDVVAILRKKLNTKKIGHTGTLDPMATGVLPICIGKATRFSDYFMNQGKSYIASLKFGQSTTTFDSTGDIVNVSDKSIFTKEKIESTLGKFVGKIKQVPSIYSAIKIDGKKLYEYARENKEVDIKEREVEIYEIKLLSVENDTAKIEVSCSKGTYIRSLIHDLGLELGSYAHMTDLIRNRVGKFDIKDSLDITKIDNYSVEEIVDMFYDPLEALYNLGRINVKDDVFLRLKNGQRLNINSLDFESENIQKDRDILVLVRDVFLGIGKITGNILKMEKVLCE